MVWKGKDPDRYRKLTVRDLQTLEELQIGGRVKAQKGHVVLPAAPSTSSPFRGPRRVPPPTRPAERYHCIDPDRLELRIRKESPQRP